MAIFESHRYERHHHEHNTTVVEKRAPTDESVRLLREMEQKARDAVLQSIRLKDCPIDGVIHVHEDHINCRRRFMVIYKVNGQRREVEADADSWSGTEEIAQKVIDKVARDIAVSILAPHFRAALGTP